MKKNHKPIDDEINVCEKGRNFFRKRACHFLMHMHTFSLCARYARNCNAERVKRRQG